jgi:hypothetical protein
MNGIEYSIEFERLLNHYKLIRHRVRAFAIEKPYLSSYDVARYFNLSQPTAIYHMNNKILTRVYTRKSN